MGWGCTLNNVFISRIKKADLEWNLEEAKEDVNQITMSLIALTAADQHEVYDIDGNRLAWTEYTVAVVRELTTRLEEAHYKQQLCSLALADMDNITDD